MSFHKTSSASGEPVFRILLASDGTAGKTLTASEIAAGLDLGALSPGDRPRVLLNMISTADGRASIGGRSGPIGNLADRRLFHALRAVTDAVMVGAGTVRAEHYGPIVRDEAVRSWRRERGLEEEPVACIVSGRLALEEEVADIPLLRDPRARLVIITSSPASLRESGPPITYVRAAREGHLDLAAAMGSLYSDLGLANVLCEGGPHLIAQLIAAGLADELFLALAPKLAGGDGAAGGGSLRILSGAEYEPPRDMDLVAAYEQDSHLFLRYRLRAAS